MALVLLVLCGIGFVLFIEGCGEGSFGCTGGGWSSHTPEFEAKLRSIRDACNKRISLDEAERARERAGW